MNDSLKTSWWYLRRSADTMTLVPLGAWKLINLPRIAKFFSTPLYPPGTRIRIDGSSLSELDTAGAMLLYELVGGARCNLSAIELVGFHARHHSIANLVKERLHREGCHDLPPPLNVAQRTGKVTLSILDGFQDLIAFIGETLTALTRVVQNPKRFRIKELIVQLEAVCVDAIPIAALVTLLIGIVVAYLFAMQLVQYGANIFIVDGVVLAMCRELAPITIAITLAGRSGSAFTAQLGTMKINQEIDAMITSGLSPMQVLVLPRVCALIIALPLLTFVGDFIGIIGGLIISHWYVGISDGAFFDRIQSNFPFKSFYLGLLKAPVFAAFIGVIGCQMGLAVENNARSVGLNTTSTVVQSIVAVIVINALFAVLFAHAGFY